MSNINDFKFQKTNYPEQFAVRVVTEDGEEMFENLTEAQKKYAELNPTVNGMTFTWGMFDGYYNGKPVMRFETWEVERSLSI